MLGAVIGATNLIAFPHEAFHVMAAASEGIDASQVSRSSSSISRLTTKNVAAGYYGEVWLFTILAVVFALAGGPRHPILTGAFPLGYTFTTWIQAMLSSDFDLIITMSGNAPGYSGELYLRWTVFCLIMITLSGIVVVKRLVKKEKARH